MNTEYKEPMYVLYSGGMGSFLSAYLLKKLGYTDVTLYFNDTRTEDEDLYRFLEETVDYLGYPLIEDTDGRTIWDVFVDKRYMGNTRVDPCSQILKRDRSRRFFSNLSPCTVFVGMSVWEEDRLTRARTYWEGIDLRSILVDQEVYDIPALKEEALQATGIRQPRLYEWGLAHNNCGGFCVKAGLKHYKALWEASPETYKMFEDKEHRVYTEVPRARPFLRKTKGGVTRYMTLREYREEYLEVGKGEEITKDEIDTSCLSCALL